MLLQTKSKSELFQSDIEMFNSPFLSYRKEPEAEVKKELDPEAKAAILRETIPIEERIIVFKQMLEEKDVSLTDLFALSFISSYKLLSWQVSAFSTWEKELHKIVFDERYLLLTSKERKNVFDDFVRDRAEMEREERRKQYKQARDDFRQLLEESDVTSKTSFSSFSQKQGKDERFRKIEKLRERETLFQDYINELRKKERDDKSSRKEKVSYLKCIQIHDSIVSSIQAKKDFFEMLKELHERDRLDKRTRWSEVKDELRHDVRYEQLESSSLREELFNTFVSNHVTEPTAESKEEQKERLKKERTEASLRERQKEVEKELSTHLKEREKEQEKVRRSEAIETFTAILVDLIKSEDYSWREARSILKNDNRIDLCEVLSREEKELFFNQHLQSLHKKKRDKFREALSEIKSIDIFKAEWRDVRRLIKDDPRFLKFSSSDRRAEREFRDYVEDRLIQAKNEFKDFLKETKILTYKSKKLIDESDQHLQDIVAILQNDQRYLILDCIEDERREILLNYVDDLERKGPPPPPTATEPPAKK